MMNENAQYYADINESGNITGFYVDDIHGDNIPETAIPITFEEWQTYSSDARLYKLDGETFREKTQEEIDEEAAATPPVEIPKTEDQLRIEQLENDNLTLMEVVADLYEMVIGGTA